MNYNFLGHGTAAGSSWTLAGLNFSTQQNLYIRGRGHYRSGIYGGSESIQETVRNVFLTPTPTPSPSPIAFAFAFAHSKASHAGKHLDPAAGGNR